MTSPAENLRLRRTTAERRASCLGLDRPGATLGKPPDGRKYDYSIDRLRGSAWRTSGRDRRRRSHAGRDLGSGLAPTVVEKTAVVIVKKRVVRDTPWSSPRRSSADPWPEARRAAAVDAAHAVMRASLARADGRAIVVRPIVSQGGKDEAYHGDRATRRERHGGLCGRNLHQQCDGQEAGRRGQDQLHDEVPKDAAATCDATAASKKLAGRPRRASPPRCVKDAIGG